MIRFLTIVTLLLLFSCAKKVETSVTTLKLFSGSIGTTANPYFDGGILVFGVNEEKGEHISGALAHEFDAAEIVVSKGTWSFIAVGFDGNGSVAPFEGVNKCGKVENILIDEPEVTVVIDMSALNCADDAFGGPQSKSGAGQIFNPTALTTCIREKDAYDQECYADTLPGVAKGFRFKVRGFEGPNTQKIWK